MCFRIKPEQIQIFYFHMDCMIIHYGMFMGGYHIFLIFLYAPHEALKQFF